MVVMTAGKLPGGIVITVVRLRTVMIVGMIQFERKIAEEHVLMFDRRARRMLDPVHGTRHRHSRKQENDRDAKHRDQSRQKGCLAGLHIAEVTAYQL